MTIENLPMSSVRTSPMNPRKTFDEEGIRELADNIRQQGLLQPITVRPIDYVEFIDRGEVESIPVAYEVVCGERRYRACALNGSETIASIVREMTDDEAFDAMITENLQRKDVDPIEESFAFAQLIKKGSSIEEIAMRFGKSPRFVQDRVKLNNLIDGLREWVRAGKMPLASAMIISKIDEDSQKKFMERSSYMGYVPKETALGFVNSLFCSLSAAPWHNGDTDFAGGCGVSCSACPFNSSNAGCLFYEMGSTPKTVKCTNRRKFEDKQIAYLRHELAFRGSEIVKSGQHAEKGKALIIDTGKPYNGTSELYERAKAAIAEAGYEIRPVNSLRKCWHDIDSEKGRALLESGEAVKVYTFFEGSCFAELKPQLYYADGVGGDKSSGELEALRLAGNYAAAMREAYDGVGKAMIGKIISEPPSSNPLTEEEEVAIIALMLSNSSNEVKRLCGIASSDILEYVKDNAGQRDFILRECLKEMLRLATDCGRPSGAACAVGRHLGEAMYPGEYEQLMAKAEAGAEKKQARIREKLEAIGYGADGRKLEYKDTEHFAQR